MPSLPKKVNGAVKNRRGHKGKYQIQNKFKLVGVNSNGISSKLQSLDHIISELNPSVICIQETKLRTVGKIKSENSKGFTIFELVRKQSRGGGLATLVKPDLNPVFISEGDDFTEILAVQVHIKELCIRVIRVLKEKHFFGPGYTQKSMMLLRQIVELLFRWMETYMQENR